MKNKIKILLITAVLCLPMMAFSQSNSPGTIQIGLGYAGRLGGATLTFSDNAGSTSTSGTGFYGNYGIRAQYGFTDNISGGVYVRAEGAVYSSDAFDDITVTGIGAGIEGKYYLVNKDRFNFYLAPSVGFVSSSASSDQLNDDVSMSGIAYGVTAGINLYFGPYVGMSFDLGYSGNSISGTPSVADDPTPGAKVKISGGGVLFGIGVVAKFGGSGGGGGGRRHRR